MRNVNQTRRVEGSAIGDKMEIVNIDLLQRVDIEDVGWDEAASGRTITLIIFTNPLISLQCLNENTWLY